MKPDGRILRKHRRDRRNAKPGAERSRHAGARDSVTSGIEGGPCHEHVRPAWGGQPRERIEAPLRLAMEPVVATDERADDRSPPREAPFEEEAAAERHRLEARGHIGFAFSAEAGEELVQVVNDPDRVHRAAPAIQTAFIRRHPQSRRRSSGGTRNPDGVHPAAPASRPFPDGTAAAKM